MRDKNRVLIAIVICIYALIAVFHMASARGGLPRYRSIHLGTALRYEAGKIDLFRPLMVGFNATDTPVPQEVPIWQALAGATFKVLGTWLGWANVLSLVLFTSALFPLYSLARTYLGERGAWWTLILFLSQPIIVITSGSAAADGLSLSISIWFVFFADRLIRTQKAVWLAPTIIVGALSAITKLPFFMAAGLASFFILLTHAPRSLRAWLFLSSAGLVGGIALMIWTRHTDSCLALAEFPAADFRVSKNPHMVFWYFGDWHYRLNPANWARGAWRALNCLFGSFALLALPLGAAAFSKNRLGQWWCVAAFLTTVVFSHLVLHHYHYYVLFSAPIAILSATALVRLEELLGIRAAWQKTVVPICVAGLLLISSVQGLGAPKFTFELDRYPQKIAAILREHTAPEDKVLLGGYGFWQVHQEFLFLTPRTGLSLRMPVTEDPVALKRLRDLGFTKLAVASESPLLHALQFYQQQEPRETYETSLTPTARSWKTVFQNEDVIIKEIPASTP